MTEIQVIERDSKQDRFNDDKNLNYASILSDWVTRSHLVEPTFGTDTRKYDSWLIDFASTEPHLVGILSSVISKDKNRSWQIIGGKNQTRRFGDRLRNAEDGAGWRYFLGLQARAYYNTSIGSLTEVETVTGKVGDAMENIYHLDPTRSRLTGNNEYPLRFYPRKGKMQNWERDEYFRTVSNPDPREDWRGLGMCAVNRCLSLAKMMISVYEHDLEQLGAMPPKGFLTAEGVTHKVYQQAQADRREARRNGESNFAIDVLALLPADGLEKTAIQFTPYSTLPVNFNLEQFTYLIILGYALAFGYDAQEFYPVQGGSFGRGAEAELQAQKTTYKGDADFSLEYQGHIQNLLPDTVDFEFDRNDIQGDLLALELEQANADLLTTLSPILDNVERRQFAVGKGLIPPDWIEGDTLEPEPIDVETDLEDNITPLEDDIDTTSDTDATDLQRATRYNLKVRRAAETFPDEPITKYSYHPKTNKAEERVIWNRGEDLLSASRVWSGIKLGQNTRTDDASSMGSITSPTRKSDGNRRKNIDPILERLLKHGEKCQCGDCEPRTVREGGALTTRAPQEGDVVWESDDGEVVITTGDIDLAIEEAGDIDPVIEELMNATEQTRMRNFVNNREFTWDSNSKRYRYSNGQFVSGETVRGYTQALVDGGASARETLAEQLNSGAINTSDAKELIRENLKRSYIQELTLGAGGRAQTSFAMYGTIGAQLKSQYRYLDGFMDAIDSGNLSEDEIRNRLNLYFESATQAYETGNAMAYGMSANELPAYPADGETVCLGRCRCYWDIQAVYKDGKLIGYDCRWTRTITDSCPDCVDNAIEYNPFKIRFQENLMARPAMARNQFHTFVIDISTAASNSATEMEILAVNIFNVVGAVAVAAWTTADIAFEVKFQHEDPQVWRPIYYRGTPIRVQIPLADKLSIAEPEIMAALRLPFTRLRIRSVDPVSYLDVNQGAARTVHLYMSE